MATQKPRYRYLILFLVAAAIIPPVLFGEPRTIDGQNGGDAWRNVLFDFQTLIGGGLAVFAAWWTVSVMEAVDQAAQKRHDQIIEATVFRDRRALLRARNHILKHTSAAKSFCSGLTSDNLPGLRAKGSRAMTIKYNNAITFVTRLNTAFTDEEWKQAGHLLVPEIIEHSTELQNVCDQFLWFAPTREERFAPEFSPTEDQIAWIIDNNSIVVIEHCLQLEKALGDWKII